MITVTLFLTKDGKAVNTEVQDENIVGGLNKFYMDNGRIAVSPVPRRRDLDAARGRAEHVAKIIGGTFCDDTVSK